MVLSAELGQRVQGEHIDKLLMSPYIYSLGHEYTWFQFQHGGVHFLVRQWLKHSADVSLDTG